MHEEGRNLGLIEAIKFVEAFSVWRKKVPEM